jgi:hypothetical protein
LPDPLATVASLHDRAEDVGNGDVSDGDAGSNVEQVSCAGGVGA